MKTCGIYKITNLINNKMYIGQSVDCNKRISTHKNALINNKHINKHLQNAYNLNKDKVNFEVYIECKQEELNDWEMFLIKALNTNNYEYGYNLTNGGDSGNSGYKHSDDIRLKISLKTKGIKKSKPTKDHCNNISKALTGRKLTKEHKIKISEKRKLQLPTFLGKTHTEETCKKMSKSRIGKIPWNLGKTYKRKVNRI